MSKVENMIRIPEETIVWELRSAREKLDAVQGLTENELQLVQVHPQVILPEMPASSKFDVDIGLRFGLGRDDNSGPTCFVWYSVQKERAELTVRVAITNKYIFDLGEKLGLPGSSHERFAGAFTYLVAGEGAEDTRKTLCEVLNGLDVFEWNLADRRV